MKYILIMLMIFSTPLIAGCKEKKTDINEVKYPLTQASFLNSYKIAERLIININTYGNTLNSIRLKALKWEKSRREITYQLSQLQKIYMIDEGNLEMQRMIKVLEKKFIRLDNEVQKGLTDLYLSNAKKGNN